MYNQGSHGKRIQYICYIHEISLTSTHNLFSILRRNRASPEHGRKNMSLSHAQSDEIRLQELPGVRKYKVLSSIDISQLFALLSQKMAKTLPNSVTIKTTVKYCCDATYRFLYVSSHSKLFMKHSEHRLTLFSVVGVFSP